MKLDSLVGQVNIAENLDEDLLTKIGQQVVTGFDEDLRSRSRWEQNLEEWTKLALLAVETKTWPWPNAANVKFPLVAIAAMQFAARAYPSLVPSDGKIVKGKVIGKDPNGEKAKKAERVGMHMSYQLLEEMEEWEEEMDRLIYILPIVGTCFKKTYFDPKKKRNVSRLVLPKDLVVNYWAKTLEDTERKTEIMEIYKRDVTKKIRQGFYLDVDLGAPTRKELNERQRSQGLTPPSSDDTTPYTILEQHGYWDLDGDGLPEPYVFTVDYSSKKVLRITARFRKDGVSTNAEGEIDEIVPVEYYTKFSFIPNPDGGFYDIGFGLLLGSLNHSIDTLINQLLDSGTLHNLQGGFFGKGLRIKSGETRFTPGEWKQVNVIGDDIKKNVFPLPAREPSGVLLNLLTFLVQSGKELASIAEIFTGKMPGQNTPATTTQTAVEQGMKVFTAIYKRVFRALKSEFKKLFELNGIYLEPAEIQNVLEEPVDLSDYDMKSVDVRPAADPQATTAQEKQAKFQFVMQLASIGTLDPMAVTMRGLEAYDVTNPQELIRQGPPPPDPKAQETEAKIKLEQMKAQLKAAQDQHKMQLEQMKMQISMAEAQQKMELERRMGEMKLHFMQQEAMLNAQIQQMEVANKQATSQMDLAVRGAQHEQGLRHREEQHKQQLQQKPKEAKKPK